MEEKQNEKNLTFLKKPFLWIFES